MKIKQISAIYGLILIIINILAVFLTSTLLCNVLTDTTLLHIMEKFLEEHTLLNITLQILPFTVPLLFCVTYTTKLNKSNDIQQRKKILANTPFVYSIIGISGWLIGFLINIVLTFYFKVKFNSYIFNFLLEQSFYYVFMVIFTFMGAFFILESINRKYVLPHFIPDGHISEIKGVFSPSITFIYYT